MTRIDLRAALDMLPRFHNAANWNVLGRRVLINAQLLPWRVDAAIAKLMAGVIHLRYESKVEWVNIPKEDIWVLHRRLKIGTLMHLYRKAWSWQKWRPARLPIYLRYNGRLIIWNGHHRTLLARLAQRRVRATVFDLNKFIEWRRALTPEAKKKIKPGLFKRRK